MQSKLKHRLGGIYALGITLLLAACGSEQAGHRSGAQPAKAIVDSTSGWYRCYKGFISDQPVTLHYTAFGDNIHAVYFYDNDQIPVELWNWADTNKTDGEIYLAESPLERTDSTARWTINIIADTVLGDWYSADGRVRRQIRLTAVEPARVQCFTVSALADSIRLVDSLPFPFATYYYQCLLPSGNDEQTAFVRNVMFKTMGCDSVDNPAVCLHLYKDRYASDYRATNREDFINGGNDMPSHAYSWIHSGNSYVVYNEQDVLVLADFAEDYTGGAHGIYSETYTNIDRRLKKVLTIADIFTADSAQLLPVLEGHARKYFGIPAGKPLSSQMLVDELDVPSNFYITGKGIVFVYGLYEVASFADGIIKLFVPYSEVMPLLRPEFRQRMNLVNTNIQS